jgi:hypothetical protein
LAISTIVSILVMLLIIRRRFLRSVQPTKDKNRVYIECSETFRKVKGIILHKDDSKLNVEMPTGYILQMQKRSKRGQYSFRIGMVEFLSDGKEVL